MTAGLVLHDSSPGGAGDASDPIPMKLIGEVKQLIGSGVKLSEYYSLPEGQAAIAEGTTGSSREFKPLAITDGKGARSTKAKPVQGRDVQEKQTQAV